MTSEVLEQYLRIYPTPRPLVVLPKRLFRNLQLPPPGTRNRHKETSAPMEFLRLLFKSVPKGIAVNSFDGYPLARAVFANYVPLVKFLLRERAHPSSNDYLPLKIAIRRKDISLLKLLVERQDHTISHGEGRKRRWLGDRIEMLSPKLLDIAVRAGVGDIVKWMMEEKNVVPSMETIQRMAWCLPVVVFRALRWRLGAKGCYHLITGCSTLGIRNSTYVLL